MPGPGKLVAVLLRAYFSKQGSACYLLSHTWPYGYDVIFFEMVLTVSCGLFHSMLPSCVFIFVHKLNYALDLEEALEGGSEHIALHVVKPQ